MANRGRTRSVIDSISPGFLTPGVKWLLVVNVAIFVVTFLGSSLDAVRQAVFLLELVPSAVVKLFMVWQLATYLFLHGGFGHIIWNMLALWMFGVQLEQTWGTRRFLTYYFTCGIGAGVCVVIVNYLARDPDVPTLGSSGAIFGLLLAYAILFPKRTIYWFFLIPIQVKYFVMIIGAVSFLMSIGGGNNGISEVAHLGGMLFGYLYLRGRRLRLNPLGAIHENYSEWRRRRLRRKFQVYLRKNKPDDGPRIQ